MSAGRPPLDDSLKKSESLRVSLTRDQMKRVLIAAANAGFNNPRDWVRRLIDEALRASEERK